MHPHLRVTKTELERDWCVADVCEAHDVLDAVDDYTSPAPKAEPVGAKRNG